MWAAGVMRLCQSNKVVLLKPFWRTGLIDRYTFNSEAANNQEIRFLCTIIAVYLKGQVMLKRQLTEGNVDDGVGDFKRSRMEDMALVTMSSDQSQQQLMIAENKNKDKRTSSLLAPTMLLSGHEGAVYSIAFDPTGQHLASASYDRNIFLWDVYGECRNYNVLSGHKNAVLEVHWTPDFLLSCSADKTVALWDANKGTRIRKCASHSGIVNSCAAARDDWSLFASGADDCSARVWDRRQRQEVLSLQHDYQVTSVCMSHDGQHCYSGGVDNIIRRWDLRSSSECDMTLEAHTDTITGLSLNADGSKLLSNSMDAQLLSWDVRPFLVEGATRLQQGFVGAKHGAEKVLLKCNWSPVGADSSEQVSCGSADRIVHIWDAATAEQLYYLPGHKGSVNQVLFHSSEPIVASCGSDKQIYLGELSA